ncbi:MAG: baseplate J/gp47 family protein [Firmicutes bacterium]|nr:baseplate J/gp47 family protein [Bacillota bacterium]
MAYELPIPEFLQENEETIHKRMLEKAPPGISIKEGDFFWDATRPTAIEKAEMTQLKLQNILRLAFPQTSYSVYLDYLGEEKGVYRHEPTPASGEILITGTPGALIPKGFIVSTQSSDSSSAIEFEIQETVRIGEDGMVLVKAECTEAGIVGNVAANTITMLSQPINGVSSITNPEPFTGGTDIEDDDSFRKRILEAYDEPLSGAKKDYERWAKEVDGVGAAYVIPLWNGPSTVKVLIMDSNGQPANEDLIAAVQNHIAPDGPLGGGKAPIGAHVTVDAPEVFAVDIAFSLFLKDGYDAETVVENIKARLRDFMAGFELNTGDRPPERITSTKVGHEILSVDGVADYASLTLNGNDEYVEIPVAKIPVLGEVTVSIT